jgi:hypothetical protein
VIEEGIVALLKADSVIDNYVDGRIYPIQFAQGNEYPMITLVTTEQPPVSGQNGICLREYDFLLSVASTLYSDCRNIGERLIVVLDKYKGAMGGLNVSNCRYQGTAMNVKENETNLYHIAYEFNILINI